MRKAVEKVISFFFLGAIIFVPLPFLDIPFQSDITQFLFAKPVTLLQSRFFENALRFVYFSSDTIALNLLLLLLGFLAILLVFGLHASKANTEKLPAIARLTVAYYLIAILLKYGFDKIFGQQFYTPEPNILYTEFGKLSKDILYWSTMGLSPTFSIVTGITEVFSAILLIFRRTRVIGLLLSVFILANIVLVNFAFDISVKTFSSLLLAASIFAAFPYLKTIFSFLVFRKITQLNDDDVHIIRNPHVKTGVKVFVLGVILLQVLYPYLPSEKPNETNHLSGAFEVVSAIQNGDTLSKQVFPEKRIFFSKDNYIVFENNEGIMADYFLQHESDNRFQMIDYAQHKTAVGFYFSGKDSLLTIEFANKSHTKIFAKALNWQQMPVLQNDFHFTIDEIK